MVSFPDISKWNISNALKIDNIFDNCNYLKNLSSLNSESKVSIFSLKLSSQSDNNNSENSLNNKNNRNNDYFNIGYFDEQNDDDKYDYYENFYSKY